MANIIISESRARAWAMEALEKCGLSTQYAHYVTDCLVHSNLRGVDTHGLIRLPSYVHRLRSTPLAPITVASDEGSVCLFDAGNQPGPVGASVAVEAAIEKARQFGTGMAAVRCSNHYGTAAYYAMKAAEAGMLGISMTNASPRIAPWGAVEPILGNNPWSIALPGAEFPVVLDMANTVVANGKIRTAFREGTPLPEGWAMDREGNPTTDPAAAMNGLLMPVGGYKGVGITVMVDLLCSVLSGGAFSSMVKRMEDTANPGGVCHFFLVADIGRLLPLEEQRARVAEYVARFKSVRLKEGVTEVYLPGELEWRTQQTRTQTGIPLSEKSVGELNDFARSIGIDPIA